MFIYSCSHISEPEIGLPLKPQPHDPIRDMPVPDMSSQYTPIALQAH
jgi:hypothetical protein